MAAGGIHFKINDVVEAINAKIGRRRMGLEEKF